MSTKVNSEEYVSLREEILQSENNIINTTGYVLVAVGAFVTAAFQLGNPLAALFSLLILYLGQVVVFNNAQTIARTSTYIRVFWEDGRDDFHYETRLSKQREIIEGEEPKEGLKVLQWVRRSVLYEQWMAPLAQWTFVWIGFACIAISVGIYWDLWASSQSQQQPSGLITSYLGLVVFVVLSVGSLIGWSLVSLRIRPLTRVLYGEGNMVKKMVDIWQEVKEKEEGEEQQ